MKKSTALGFRQLFNEVWDERVMNELRDEVYFIVKLYMDDMLNELTEELRERAKAL